MASLRFPVYIPTKGRPTRQKTVEQLRTLGISPTLVVEDAEVQAYSEANPDCRVIAWEPRFFEHYEKTPELNPHPSTGAAHNYAWYDARQRGFTHHWIMDDNILYFDVIERGVRYRQDNSEPLTWVEDWAVKWRNLAGVALNQTQFSTGTAAAKPFIYNTKLYCATLYRNDLHHSGIVWRRGVNDDTVVSIDLLKAGWVTAVSTQVAINKAPTGYLKNGKMAKRAGGGGMTAAYNKAKFEGKMAELVRLHPDCCRGHLLYKRVHHHCDYRRFQQQLRPIPSPDYWEKIDLSENSLSNPGA